MYDELYSVHSCLNMFQCKGEGRCLHPDDVCDGHVYCLQVQDDEDRRELIKCPVGCSCIGNSMLCRHTNACHFPFVITICSTNNI